MAPEVLDHRTVIHPDVLELADLLRPTWPRTSAQLLASGVPLNEGDPAAVADPPAAAAGPPKDDDILDDDKVRKDDDWQTKSRKSESRAKRAEREAAELRDRIAKLEGDSKSETEKLLEAARKEARAEALTESQKERRQDRLEAATTRFAALGVTVGDGDNAVTAKFADPDDALIYVERAIRAGDVDENEIFDEEGKVQADALQKALVDILASKPHLRASSEPGKPKGNPDTRRGHTADADLEAMSPEDHAKRKYGSAK